MLNLPVNHRMLVCSYLQMHSKKRFVYRDRLIRIIATTIPAKVDVHIPQPTIAKVTAIFGNISIYDRTVYTHKEHSRRLGYPLIVLRENVLDGNWNKMAILLRVLPQELEKPPDKRLQWLL